MDKQEVERVLNLLKEELKEARKEELKEARKEGTN